MTHSHIWPPKRFSLPYTTLVQGKSFSRHESRTQIWWFPLWRVFCFTGFLAPWWAQQSQASLSGFTFTLQLFLLVVLAVAVAAVLLRPRGKEHIRNDCFMICQPIAYREGCSLIPMVFLGVKPFDSQLQFGNFRMTSLQTQQLKTGSNHSGRISMTRCDAREDASHTEVDFVTGWFDHKSVARRVPSHQPWSMNRSLYWLVN